MARSPDFLIIGAQKAGTTWLARRVGEHPGAYVVPHELHFFDHAEIRARRMVWYEAQFAPAGPHRLTGEKTPDYLWSVRPYGDMGIAPAIRDALPNVRLLAILRDPVARTVSALNHAVHYGHVPPDSDPRELLFGGKRETGAFHGLLERGRYAEQLEIYNVLFSSERLLVGIFEDDVLGAPCALMARVTRHLGLPDHEWTEAQLTRPENRMRVSWPGCWLSWRLPRARRWVRRFDRCLPGDHRVRVGDDLMAEIADYFEPHNRALEALLGRPLTSWRH